MQSQLNHPYRPATQTAMLGLTSNYVSSVHQREAAAKTLCGKYLGECRIMMEILDYVMTDTISVVEQCRWYRHEIKQCMRRACKELTGNLAISRKSISNQDFVADVADIIYEQVKLELFKMQNGTRNELSLMHIQDAVELSHLLNVDMILAYISYLYDGVLHHMEKIAYDYSFYDSWFSSASCRNVRYWWDKALDAYSCLRLKDMDLDPNTIKSLDYGMHAIDKILDKVSKSGVNILPNKADYGDNADEAVIESAAKTLGLSVHKHHS